MITCVMFSTIWFQMLVFQGRKLMCPNPGASAFLFIKTKKFPLKAAAQWTCRAYSKNCSNFISFQRYKDWAIAPSFSKHCPRPRNTGTHNNHWKLCSWNTKQHFELSFSSVSHLKRIYNFTETFSAGRILWKPMTTNKNIWYLQSSKKYCENNAVELPLTFASLKVSATDKRKISRLVSLLLTL